MKIKATLFAILGLCAYASQALAADDKEATKKDDKHDHADHGKIIAGPNGGRVLTSVEPHLEFFVTKDRTVKITALDDKNKPAKIGKQNVSVVAGERSKPTKLKFEEKDGVLVSDGKLPEGNDFPVVVQIKTSKLAKRVNEKFNLNLKDCPTCKYKEYACACAHGEHKEGDGHDHDHDHDHDDKKK